MFVKPGEVESGVGGGVGPALGALEAAVDDLLGVDLEGLDADRAAAAIAGLERECRRLQAAQIELLAAVDSSGAYAADGHFSAKVMMRHHARLSGVEASRRDGVRRALRDLPLVTESYRCGLVGTDQVRRLARVWANSRVREFVSVCETGFLSAATSMEFPDFDLFCRDWENTVDADGSLARTEQRWRRRDVKPTQDLNGMWDLRGRMMSLDGAEFNDILSRLTDAERLADIEAAQAEFGDEWRSHLPRSSGQLRYDAFMSLVRRGAAAAPGTAGGDVVTNIVIDQRTFEYQLELLCGAEPEPLDPTDTDRLSRTADGVWVSPAETVARALVGHVRRVVVDAAGVVVDVGRRQRLFTGSPRLAAMLATTRCYWHGCWTPATKCQIDHLTPFRNGGATNSANGLPACGGHNLTKEQGFHVWRTRDGTWVIQRPDGTRTPDHNSQWHQPRAA